MLIEIIPNWHPIVVHFTVALLSVAATLFIAAPFVPHAAIRRQGLIVARWNLWFGAGAAIMTVIAGFLAFNAVPHSSEAQHAAMIDHRNWALATATLFVILAGWSLADTLRGADELQGWKRGMFVSAICFAACLLLVTGYKGGELVYRHGLGVMATQATGAGADGHAHGAGASHETESEAMDGGAHGSNGSSATSGGNHAH